MTFKEEREFLNHIQAAYFHIEDARKICGRGQNELVEQADRTLYKLFRETVQQVWGTPERLDLLLKHLKKERS